MRARLAALVLCTIAAAAAFADRETAQFSASRADKALAAKKWDEAESLYRKALEEDDTFLLARYGLAQSLIGAGKSAPAIEELRKFVDDAHAASALPAEWKPVLAKAEKQLGDLDAAGAALQKIQDGYVDALMDFAQRWATKDPGSAERALRRVLKLRPGHAKAAQLLQKAGSSTAGEVVELFDGKTFTGWMDSAAPTWTVDQGAITGQVQNAAYIMRSLRSFEGDFTVRCEARVIDEYAQPVMFAFTACMKGESDYYVVGVLRGKLLFSDERGPGKGRDVAFIAPTELKKPFDPKQWNTYELRCSGNSSVALVNGEEIGHEERPEWRKGGFIALKVQNLKVEFRKVQVEVK